MFKCLKVCKTFQKSTASLSTTGSYVKSRRRLVKVLPPIVLSEMDLSFYNFVVM